MRDDKRDQNGSAQAGDQPSSVDRNDSPSTSRRRFAKSGIAAPILMTLVSRPVLGQGRFCSPSAFASMNPSRPVDESTCAGCSPGYWHQENACWHQTGLARTNTIDETYGFNTSIYSGFTAKEKAVLQLQLQQLFPGPNYWDYTFKGDQLKLYQMLRAATAVTLGIRHPLVPIPITTSDVVYRLHEVLAPDGSYRKPLMYTTLKDYFETFYDKDNNIGCPLPNSGNCPDIISYG